MERQAINRDKGANPFGSGYQLGRVNTHNNLFTANRVAPLTQVLNMVGNYTNGFLHFRPSAAQRPGRLSLTQAVY